MQQTGGVSLAADRLATVLGTAATALPADGRSGAQSWLAALQASARGEHAVAMQAARDALARLAPSSFDDAALAKLEGILWRGGAAHNATAVSETRLRAAWSVDRPLPLSLTTAGRTMFFARPELFSYLATRRVCILDGAPLPADLAGTVDYIVRAGAYPAGASDRTDIHILMCEEPVPLSRVPIRIAFAAEASTWRSYCNRLLDHAAQGVFADESLAIGDDTPQPDAWNVPPLSAAARRFLQIVVPMACCGAITIVSGDGASHTIAR